MNRIFVMDCYDDSIIDLAGAVRPSACRWGWGCLKGKKSGNTK